MVQNLITDTYLQGPAQMKGRCVFFKHVGDSISNHVNERDLNKRDKIYFNDFYILKEISGICLTHFV